MDLKKSQKGSQGDVTAPETVPMLPTSPPPGGDIAPAPRPKLILPSANSPKAASEPPRVVIGSAPSKESIQSENRSKQSREASETPERQREVRRVDLHVTFRKIGEINTLKEQYDADVLITSKWREPQLDKGVKKDFRKIVWEDYWNPKLFIENALGDMKENSSQFLSHDADGNAYVIERKRMKGAFSETLELWEFPFDVQDLTVTVMSDMASTEVILEEDPDEMHKINKQSFIDEQEWHLYKCIQSEKKLYTKDVSDPSQVRPALCVMCRASRRPAYFVWNMFMITFLIVSLSFVTFAVNPDFPQNRLQLTFTLVLTSVAFKFTVNQSLPRISYLTYLDKYILFAMWMIAFICFWHGLQSTLPSWLNPVKEYVAVSGFIGIYVAYNLYFAYGLITNPYHTRRQMVKLEKEYAEKIKKYAEKKRKEEEEGLNKLTMVQIEPEPETPVSRRISSQQMFSAQGYRKTSMSHTYDMDTRRSKLEDAKATWWSTSGIKKS